MMLFTGFLSYPFFDWTLIEALRSFVILSVAKHTRLVLNWKRRFGLKVMFTFFLDLALTTPL